MPAAIVTYIQLGIFARGVDFVLSYVIFIGLINLALGLGLAWYLRRSPNVELFIPKVSFPERIERPLRALLEKLGISNEDLLCEDVVNGDANHPRHSAHANTIPHVPIIVNDEAVQELLGGEDSALNDESLGGLLSRLATAFEFHRESMLAIESRAQAKLAAISDEPITDLLQDFQTLSQLWGARLTTVAEKLHESLGQFTEKRELAAELEDQLLEQAVQIHAACRLNLQLELSQEKIACHYLLTDICSLAAINFAFRDHVVAWQVRATAHAVALEMPLASSAQPVGDEGLQPTPSQSPETNQLLSYSEFEKSIRRWTTNTTSRDDSARVALIDLDRFSFVNTRHGVQVGDELLSQFGRLLKELVDLEHQPIETAVLSGQRFALFIPHHTLSDAIQLLERLRQSFEAITFGLGTNDCVVTFSSGLLEINGATSSDEVVRRLRLIVLAAKQAGRNRTAVEEKDKLRVVKPIRFPTQAKFVTLNLGGAPSRTEATPPDPLLLLAEKNGDPLPPAGEPVLQSAG